MINVLMLNGNLTVTFYCSRKYDMHNLSTVGRASIVKKYVVDSGTDAYHRLFNCLNEWLFNCRRNHSKLRSNIEAAVRRLRVYW